MSAIPKPRPGRPPARHDPAAEAETAAARGRIGERFRALRRRLGLTQESFAAVYGIPLASIRQYEIGRHMPPPAVRAYLAVIEAEPDMTARVVAAGLEDP
ncbi:MAG: helix-turn-helix domain-containing protein [Alphaproteobacteria bacterium]|nr:helix-turn-helix domain-containing protein [Alphaproteobacteria bacterium]